MKNERRYVRALKDLSLSDLPEVGGKNASLGEMIRSLAPSGVRVPGGFAVTAAGYRRFVESAGLAPVLARVLAGLDARDLAVLAAQGRAAREAILAAPVPPDLEAEILSAFVALGPGVSVAVRSSATAEDLPESSFAGALESFLDVKSGAELLDAYRKCLASLFTDRAISYRIDRGYAQEDVAVSVGVQRMVRSDQACAGVLFTLDTESGFRDVVLISSSWGLGESVVKGRVDPDEFLVHKPTLARGFRPILKRAAGAKQEKLVRGADGRPVAVPVPDAERAALSLRDDEVLQLARWGVAIEEHYSRRAGKPVPMDVEWAKDGPDGGLFIVQARPETVHAKPAAVVETFRLKGKGTVLARGRAVGQRIGAGAARKIRGVADLPSFRPGDVLVAESTDPDWEPTMKMASAIVTDRGGRTCHAAIVSRELGVPCVVGTGDGTAQIADGEEVTVSCAEGDEGRVYQGRLAFERSAVDLSSLPRTRTKIQMNVADPDRAFALAALPNDGVGLAREEFIVSGAIGVHPLALTRFDTLPPGPDRDEIARRTAGYADRGDFFVEKLAEGVGRIAAAFWPKPVLVRLSDFKTNEYATLLGGAGFEEPEENPMIGFRGASRYYDDRYRDGFALECRAMRKVREEMGLVNVRLMVPFCRTPEEGRRVLETMAASGLVRGRDGLQIWVMCEIPSNVILTEAFAAVFDGFSIGSNDLTQLTLGVDRDSERLAPLFDERNAAVTSLIAEAIARAHAAGKPIGICGQAPSDHPDFARFLVERGIDSMSLSPDRVVETTRLVAGIEAERPGPRPPQPEVHP